MLYNKSGCNWSIDLLKMYAIDAIVKKKISVDEFNDNDAQTSLTMTVYPKPNLSNKDVSIHDKFGLTIFKIQKHIICILFLKE